MPTFTEVLPASKSNPHRAMRYTPACVGLGVVELSDRKTLTRYAVACLPFGGAKFTKPGGTESYVATERRCECKGFTFSKTGAPCKHIECLRALVANRWLEHDGRETANDRAAEVEEKDAYYTARGV